MPSPVGHSLIGLAIGLAYELPRTPWLNLGAALRRHWRVLLLAVVLANVPDVDYLPGLVIGDAHAFHHGYTHTLGWVVAVVVAVWLAQRRPYRVTGLHVLGLATAVLVSHLVADWVTADGSAPYGIMALWPFSDTYFISPVTMFWELKKSSWSAVWQWHNVWAVSVEVAWGLPLVFLACILKCGRPLRARVDRGRRD